MITLNPAVTDRRYSGDVNLIEKLLTASSGYFRQGADVDALGIGLANENALGLHSVTFIGFGLETGAKVQNILQAESGSSR